MADPTPISDELVAKLVELTNLDEDRVRSYSISPPLKHEGF